MTIHTDHTIHDIQQMRNAIFYLGKVKNCYLDAGMTVEALSVGTMIGIRRKQLDDFIAGLTTTNGERND